MTVKPCRFEMDEVCVNAACPMCADFCPVPDTPGVCRYEDRADVGIGPYGNDKNDRAQP